MISFKSTFSLFLAACCAISFTSCHKSSRSSSSDDVPSDDPTLEDTQKPSYEFLLPENVLSADFIVTGKNGFLLTLHLNHVNIIGSDWSAEVTGTVSRPSEELSGEYDDEGITTLNLTPSIIQRDGSSGIVLKVRNYGEPQDGKEASLEISSMDINITDENKESRLGNVANIASALLHYQTGIQEGDIDKLDFTFYAQNAEVKLINYVLK